MREKKRERDPGFEAAQIAAFLRENAEKLEKAKLPERAGMATGALAREEAKFAARDWRRRSSAAASFRGSKIWSGG